MSGPAIFRAALIAAYREHPCQVLPNALWKSLLWEIDYQTDFSIDESGRVTRLLARDAQNLMLFWARERSLTHFPFDLDDDLDFALIHQDFENCIRLDAFNRRETYFRLVHRMQGIPVPDLPPGFSCATAHPAREAQQIADLIAQCYDDMRISSETVSGWQIHPVFDPQLWVWIIDDTNHIPAGLGIAEFDPLIAEGSLEWVQVLPDYRGCGLGKQLVYELLRRLKGRAEFVTVSGQVDNQSRPEMLYRRCGFEGDDLWWVLRR